MAFLNAGLVIILATIVVFAGWIASTAGFGPRLNSLLGILILGIIAAIVWNFTQNRITLILAALLIGSGIVLGGCWVYFVKNTPSITTNKRQEQPSR